MIATERLYLTADRKKVVAAGDKAAAALYATPGDEIPESAVERFGLTDGGLPKAKPPSGGAKGDDAAKEKKAAANKEAGSGGDKSGAEAG